MTAEAKVGAFTVVGVVLFAAVAMLLSGVSLSGHKDIHFTRDSSRSSASSRSRSCAFQAFPSARSRASAMMAAA